MNDQHCEPAADAASEARVIDARVRAVTDTGLDAVGDPLFDRIAGLVRNLLGVPVALVSLLDARRQFFPGAAGLSEPWATVRQTPLSHALCQPVAVAQDPLVVTDARDDERCSANPAITELRIVGYAGMPLTDADGTVLGALCAIDHEPRAWTQAELSLLADMALACSDSLRLRIVTRHAEAGQAGEAAANRQAQAASQRSKLLLTASELLTEARTVAQIVAAIAGLTSPAFAPAHIGMVLVDAEQQRQVIGTDSLPEDVAARGISFPAAAPLPAAAGYFSGQLFALADPAAIRAGFPQLADEIAALGWQAIACQPVPGVPGRLGVLTFSWTHPHEFDADQRSVMAGVAGYVGQALQRVTHLQEQNTAARILQQALLTRLPRTASIRLAARYLPAHHGDLVGGDWYDAIPLPDGRLAVVIGDVCGHSLTAAAAMSELRSMLRGLLIDRAETPAGMLQRLDHANNALGAHTIATVLIAYLDREADGSHTLHWSNAGHPFPTVLTADGHVTALPGTDPLLGFRHHHPRTTHHHRLPPGAALLLYTDGLVETRDTTIDDGITRLHQLLAARHDNDPDTLADQLVAHADARTREDDVALIIATTAPADHDTDTDKLEYREPVNEAVDPAGGSQLREPEEEIATVHGRLDFTEGQLHRLRDLVSVAARRAGLDEQRQESLVFAVNEAAINAIEHGGGRGHLDVVQEDQWLLIAQVSDHGPGLPPGLELVSPEPAATRGRGLRLMRKSCDRVELRSGPSGTTVRLEMDLRASTS